MGCIQIGGTKKASPSPKFVDVARSPHIDVRKTKQPKVEQEAVSPR